MADKAPSRSEQSAPIGKSHKRIETQIHRRKKAKAVFPLEAEWTLESSTPPDLRMPSTNMVRVKESGHPPR